jgi:hypothetical protein
VVVNIRLVPKRLVDPVGDSMGRSWYGYDPDCTDAELWAQNRGEYGLAEARIKDERFATLSHRGKIVLVASLRGWEPVEDLERGVWEKALVGNVLVAGDPTCDALHGRPVPSGRSAFVYLNDAEVGVIGIDASSPGQSSASPDGQGLQMDPVRRKRIENAAQDRLMQHYRARGWSVTDTRLGNPYDAVARRSGEVLFLEAKGTESAGTAVLLTSGEVQHARRYLGQCVMGILSGICLDDDGQVDPDSGTLRLLPFEPQGDELVVTGYRWQLPEE